MKHYMKWMATAIVAGAVALVNVKVVLDANRTNDLVETTLETFGQNTGGGQESNNHGSGKFYYEHKLGDPHTCTLTKYINVHGEIVDPGSGVSIDGSYTLINVQGMYEACPHKGNGCTVYSCQQNN